jgi:hypothetical protein
MAANAHSLNDVVEGASLRGRLAPPRVVMELVSGTRRLWPGSYTVPQAPPAVGSPQLYYIQLSGPCVSVNELQTIKCRIPTTSAFQLGRAPHM